MAAIINHGRDRIVIGHPRDPRKHLLRLGSQDDRGLVGAAQPTQEIDADTLSALRKIPAFVGLEKAERISVVGA